MSNLCLSYFVVKALLYTDSPPPPTGTPRMVHIHVYYMKYIFLKKKWKVKTGIPLQPRRLRRLGDTDAHDVPDANLLAAGPSSSRAPARAPRHHVRRSWSALRCGCWGRRASHTHARRGRRVSGAGAEAGAVGWWWWWRGRGRMYVCIIYMSMACQCVWIQSGCIYLSDVCTVVSCYECNSSVLYRCMTWMRLIWICWEHSLPALYITLRSIFIYSHSTYSLMYVYLHIHIHLLGPYV